MDVPVFAKIHYSRSNSLGLFWFMFTFYVYKNIHLRLFFNVFNLTFYVYTFHLPFHDWSVHTLLFGLSHIRIILIPNGRSSEKSSRSITLENSRELAFPLATTSVEERMMAMMVMMMDRKLSPIFLNQHLTKVARHKLRGNFPCHELIFAWWAPHPIKHKVHSK